MAPVELVHGHLRALREPERRRPPPPRTPPDRTRAMLSPRPIQIHQRLLQTMSWNVFQPRMLGLGLGQLFGLRLVVHPRAAAAIFTTLLQTGIPHRPAGRANPLGELCLRVGELDPKPPPRE